MKYLKYLPMVLLTLFSVKLLRNQGTVNDIYAVVVMSFLAYAFVKADASSEIEEVQSEVEEIRREVEEMKKINEDIKGGISSLKMATGLRQVERRNA